MKGKEKDCFTAASFASSEIEECMDERILQYVDFLAVNKDEMRSIMRALGHSERTAYSEGYRNLRTINPNLQMIVTLGREGALVFSQSNEMKVPAIWRSAVNTAGAGDCFLGTMIAGVIALVMLASGNGIPDGYYQYQDQSYYRQGSTWYRYQPSTDDWYKTTLDQITKDNADQYRLENFSGKRFEESQWYDNGSSDDDSWDNDSWDDSDDWDDSDTDWDSDW